MEISPKPTFGPLRPPVIQLQGCPSSGHSPESRLIGCMARAPRSWVANDNRFHTDTLPLRLKRKGAATLEDLRALLPLCGQSIESP